MAFFFHLHLTKKRQRAWTDHAMSIAAVAHPLTAAPQIYSIYSSHNVAGISLWTWLGFMLLGLVFLAYGAIHRIKPLLVTQTLWFIVDFLIVIGVIIYS